MKFEEFTGMIKSVSTKSSKVLMNDGSKINEGSYIVTIATNSIEYDNMDDFNPVIREILQAVEPMPFKVVNFGEMMIEGLKVGIIGTDDNGDYDREGITSFAKIKNLSIKNNENIPEWNICLELPKECNGRYFLQNLKSRVLVQFEKDATLL